MHLTYSAKAVIGYNSRSNPKLGLEMLLFFLDFSTLAPVVQTSLGPLSDISKVTALVCTLRVKKYLNSVQRDRDKDGRRSFTSPHRLFKLRRWHFGNTLDAAHDPSRRIRSKWGEERRLDAWKKPEYWARLCTRSQSHHAWLLLATEQAQTLWIDAVRTSVHTRVF